MARSRSLTTPGDSLKAVVFDWDLTLWNSWDTHLELLRQTADALGAPRPEVGEVAARYSMPFLQQSQTKEHQNLQGGKNHHIM